MNIVGNSSNEILFVNFNQDFSCIAVGTKLGYKIYNCDPFGKCHSKTEGGIGIVEMLFSTSLVALVGAGDQPAFSPRRLQINNTKRESTICEMTFPTSILSVKLNRKRMVVVLEEEIYIYDIANMKLLHTIETSSNPRAICALSPSNDNCYLAYPAPLPSTTSPFSAQAGAKTGGASGEVIIFDAITLQVINIIPAHKSPISFMAMNPEGTMLATASDKGTVIRVFGLPNATKLYQFRRGSYAARIYSISFNMVSSLLCVSSDSDTVHIFRLGPTGRQANSLPIPDNPSRRTSLQNMVGRRLAGSMGNYLPDAFTEMWEPARDFAFLKLPNVGVQSLVALSSTTPQVMVVTSEGYLFQYNIDLENGGECVLLKQFSLLEASDDLGTGLLIN